MYPFLELDIAIGQYFLGIKTSQCIKQCAVYVWMLCNGQAVTGLKLGDSVPWACISSGLRMFEQTCPGFLEHGGGGSFHWDDCCLCVVCTHKPTSHHMWLSLKINLFSLARLSWNSGMYWHGSFSSLFHSAGIVRIWWQPDGIKTYHVIKCDKTIWLKSCVCHSCISAGGQVLC